MSTWAVILAGGSGTRFWPLSTPERPKQLLPLAGDRPLVWDKVDYDTWRIRTNGAKAVTLRFHYAADSLDNAMAWARSDFLLFNGTNIFLYPEGQPLEYAATVTVHTEPDWHVATGMPSTESARTYAAANYHDLVDMPFFVGHFDLDSARIANRWVRLATYPAGAVGGQTRSTASSLRPARLRPARPSRSARPP